MLAKDLEDANQKLQETFKDVLEYDFKIDFLNDKGEASEEQLDMFKGNDTEKVIN